MGLKRTILIIPFLSLTGKSSGNPFTSRPNMHPRAEMYRALPPPVLGTNFRSAVVKAFLPCFLHKKSKCCTAALRWPFHDVSSQLRI